MRKSVVVALVVLSVVLGAVGGVLAFGKPLFDVILNEGAVGNLSVQPGATVQVIRLAPEDAPLKLLVLTHVPGDSTAHLQFFMMDVRGRTVAVEATCAGGSPFPGGVCVNGGWVPANHPLTRKR